MLSVWRRRSAPLLSWQGCSGSSLPSLSGSLPSWFSRSEQFGDAGPGVGAGRQGRWKTIVRRSISGPAPARWRSPAKPKEATANDLRYQLTFIELARQCFVDGGNVRMRVGVQGRAIVGPAGAPPQVAAPIRYAVVQEGVQPKTIVDQVPARSGDA